MRLTGKGSALLTPHPPFFPPSNACQLIDGYEPGLLSVLLRMFWRKLSTSMGMGMMVLVLSLAISTMVWR